MTSYLGAPHYVSYFLLDPLTVDSMSDTKAPPSYDTIPTSTSQLGVPIPPRFKWPWMRGGNKKHVLSCIRNLVTATNYTPSSVIPIVNSCATALSSAEFSNLLQSCNIEGHTALYWAIVNCRLDALWALMGFISETSFDCSSDLRLACMATSNNEVFMKLNLRRTMSNTSMSIPAREYLYLLLSTY